MRATKLGAGLLCMALSACADATADAPQVSRETRGDTTIVRVAGASTPDSAVIEVRIGELEGADEYTFGDVSGMAVAADGSMYVLDEQALTIRVYDTEGRHVRSFGRSGGGPGELKQPMGMLFLDDGRLVVRDPGNTRMNVYSPAGEALTTWRIPGGFFTSAPMFSDQANSVYTDIIGTRREDGTWDDVLLKLDSTGAEVDTLPRPFGDYDAPYLVAERRTGQNRMMSATEIPFWPASHSALNSRGEFVGGIADRYALLNWRADGTVLRIERDVPPVPVDPAELEAAVERAMRSMRNVDPDWRWDAPQPPATKPAFTSLTVADDDRIWVRVSQPAVRQPPDPDAKPDDEGRMPVDSWLEPMVYEVFEPTGEFVGATRLPQRFRPMFMRGDHVWGVWRDEFDVQYVVRIRALHGA